MKYYDLTHAIDNSTPVYPGAERPQLSVAATVEQSGFHETLLHMFSHTGTHMDAPAHMIHYAPTLDSYPPERFIGPAYVLDCASLGAGGIITPELLRRHREEIEAADFLLLYTGWDRYWETTAYFGVFPVLSAEAALWLGELRRLKAVGMDAVSFDLVGIPFFENHRILLGMDKLLIENLTGLAPIAGRTVCFTALPLHYAHADGAPVRAVAWETT